MDHTELTPCSFVEIYYFAEMGYIIINSLNILAVRCDFQQCGILTCVDSDEPV